MDNKDTDKPIIDSNIRRANYATKKGEVVLREHEYDGIQEFDQKLPNWWLFTLWGAVAAFLIYYTLYYTLNIIPSATDVMDQKVETVKKHRAKALQDLLANMNDVSLVNTWSKDPKVIAKGEAIYKKTCVACHAADYAANGGTTGRALNDGIWEHGGSPMDVFKIINEGTPDGSKGLNGMKMVAWGKSGLSAEQCAQVTAFIISINPDEFEKYGSGTPPKVTPTKKATPKATNEDQSKDKAADADNAKALNDLLASLNDDTLVNTWSTNPEIVAKGEAIYKKTCLACHGADYAAKSGLSRPLNDGKWEHGSTPMDVFKIINDGSPANSPGVNGLKMVAWGKSGLSAEQCAQVTAFLISINPNDFKKYKK